jgi:hypothetical protein
MCTIFFFRQSLRKIFQLTTFTRRLYDFFTRRLETEEVSSVIHTQPCDTTINNQHHQHHHQQSTMDNKEDEMIVLASNRIVKAVFDFAHSSSDECIAKDQSIAKDHRIRRRTKRRRFRHDEAFAAIYRDYIGPSPLFQDQGFKEMFRITKRRFETLYQQMVVAIPFFQVGADAFGKRGASTYAKLLLPLKCMAFGIPSKALCDYFQMSQTLARECYRQFTKSCKLLFQEEFLRIPTPADLKALNALHFAQHEVKGMVGSLDCMHIAWKNCAKAWQGAYQGKAGKPTLILEAACDYNLWFWHASFGYPGSMNDINVFNLSPLLDAFLTGMFAENEKEEVPFVVDEEVFSMLFFLVDGIYPPYSRFVGSIQQPVTEKETVFSKWQEAKRKDIERAFGVLQGKFQVLARPILLINLDLIAELVSTCLILHNMCVQDRIMGDGSTHYDPLFGKFQEEFNGEEVETADADAADANAADVNATDANAIERKVSPIGVRNGENPAMVDAMLQRWSGLSDRKENARLRDALTQHLWKNGGTKDNLV